MQPDDDAAEVVEVARRALNENLLSGDDRVLVGRLLHDTPWAEQGTALSSLIDVVLSYPTLRKVLQEQAVDAAHAPPHELSRRRALLYLGRVALSRWHELSSKRWSVLTSTELKWAIKDAESGDDRAAEQILTILRRNPDTIRWINELDPELKAGGRADEHYHSTARGVHLTASNQDAVARFTYPRSGSGSPPPRSRRPFDGGGGQQGG
jgi:hypothetical protein